MYIKLLNLFNLQLATLFVVAHCYVRYKSVYQKINQEIEFSTFAGLIQNNSVIKRAILYSNVTVFVPENDAFEKYNGVFKKELTYYHISIEIKSLKNLSPTSSLYTLSDEFPPLWITKRGDDIYVNNAKIVNAKSNYFSNTMIEDHRYDQVMHVIDEVLDPHDVYSTNPTAYEVISNYSQKEGHFRTLNFKLKIQQNNQEQLFAKSGFNTYFVPIDKGFDDHRYKMLDKYMIGGHIVPNQVLFTRPAVKNFFVESKSNGDYIYILLSFVEIGDKLFVKSNTVLGDTDHKRGEVLAELVVSNIPVTNGVLHFISQPLGVFDAELKPFPFLPILDKLSQDPELDVTYRLGSVTNINDNLTKNKQSLTYFVPRNKAWEGRFRANSVVTETEKRMLGRHLIISDVQYTMKKLVTLSKEGQVTLNSLSGEINVSVIKNRDSFFVIYEHRYIKVSRPDYVCTDGIIHIIDEAFWGLDEHVERYEKIIKEETGAGYNFWRWLKNLVM